MILRGIPVIIHFRTDNWKEQAVTQKETQSCIRWHRHWIVRVSTKPTAPQQVPISITRSAYHAKGPLRNTKKWNSNFLHVRGNQNLYHDLQGQRSNKPSLSSRVKGKTAGDSGGSPDASATGIPFLAGLAWVAHLFYMEFCCLIKYPFETKKKAGRQTALTRQVFFWHVRLPRRRSTAGAQGEGPFWQPRLSRLSTLLNKLGSRDTLH